MASRVLIDCDPGHDDAIAILLALASPEALEVAAVTAVAGNVPLTLTEVNARKVCAVAGRTDIPVHAGCARPLVRPLETAEYVHGDTGLDGVELPAPAAPLAPGHAADAIVEIVRSRPAGTVTLCPTGPLTNVALAMIKAPDIVPRLSEIVLMGGAIGLGNTTPAAEFNVYVDPHAARVVFESGAGITMIGLEATHQALCTPARLEAIRALGTEVGRIVTGWLEFYNRYDRRLADGEPGGPLHDPCVIAYLLRPELFAGRRCRVDIETAGELTVGRTVVDWRGRLGLPPNATVIDRLVDADGFFALLTERLGRL